MNKKSQAPTWLDVQLAIAAVAVTASLGFWNYFATPTRPVTETQPADVPPDPPAAATPEPTAQTVQVYTPVKIFFNGSAPQQVQIVQQVPQQSQPAARKHTQPVTTTGSSKP